MCKHYSGLLGYVSEQTSRNPCSLEAYVLTTSRVVYYADTNGMISKESGIRHSDVDLDSNHSLCIAISAGQKSE